jgi:hypothetical protein
MQSNIEACRVFALSLASVTQASAISDLHARKSTSAFLPTGVRLFAYEARAAYSGASPAFHIGAGLCRLETRRAIIQSGDHSAERSATPSLLFWRANQFLRPQSACRLRHSSAVARYSSRVCVTTLPEPHLGLSSHPSQSVQMGLKSINLHNCAVRPFGFHEPLPAIT